MAELPENMFLLLLYIGGLCSLLAIGGSVEYLWKYWKE